ncbi:membrane protein [Motilibacter rhizosphaerae]|uniref:Membrane protein n=1 Tax=Motilibacter rhizosphaerae TaxID=598652 RepID=A0A4Q7NQ66_9ACTN|nr:YhjD/YihY/BrkB family envelope integrity protein [Motilibacter rhizosphaerae]RZS87136.1 membrane protein [Motilibacter rhizosphaerae]
MGPLVAAVTAWLRRVRRRLTGRDLALVGAGLTFYAGIAVVPGLLVASWAAGLLVGEPRMVSFAGSLGRALPDSLGAPGVARRLVDTGAHLHWVQALVAAFPASLYGEGLRRSFLSLEDAGTERLVGWRGRVRVLPLIAVAPPLLLAVLGITPLLARLLRGNAAAPTALGVFVALVVDWLVLSVPVTWAYRVVGRGVGSWVAALAAGLVAASFVSGFLQGFVLFLALPIDLEAPFGGLPVVGAIVAVGLWLWVLHLVVLVGYAMALEFRAEDWREVRGKRTAHQPGTGVS